MIVVRNASFHPQCHNSSDDVSEAQLNTKACGFSIDVPIPESISRNHPWVSIDLVSILPTFALVVTSFTADFFA